MTGGAGGRMRGFDLVRLDGDRIHAHPLPA